MKFARRIDNLKPSDIREILKVTQDPSIISFAGGLPAPELFPIEAIKNVANIVLEESGSIALQYTTTEGYLPLREWISQRLNTTLDTNYDADNILITHGSQQVLDLCGKIFLDEDDIVICESPTYLAAISAFKSYGAQFIEVEGDNEGMLLNKLEEALKSSDKIKFIYLIPEFQNPTGISWSSQRRKEISSLASKYNIPIIEDNPYGELRFEGETKSAIASIDDENTIYTSTFSKIFCPGYRIGWVAANHELIKKFVAVKQAVDLQCNTLAQMEIAKYLELYDIDEHIDKIREVYRIRRDIAFDIIENKFPKSITYTKPNGGLFTWLTLPEGYNTKDLFKIAISKKVAFVPGEAFFATSKKTNSFRINFSNMQDEKIKEGLSILSDILHEFLK